VVDLETQLARRDGSCFVAHLIARAIDPAEPGQGHGLDRPRHHAGSRRPRASARLLREQQLIFQNAETGIVILRDRVIQRCNRRFRRDPGLRAGRVDRPIDPHLLPE
jgi:hypothetical protein